MKLLYICVILYPNTNCGDILMSLTNEKIRKVLNHGFCRIILLMLCDALCVVACTLASAAFFDLFFKDDVIWSWRAVLPFAVTLILCNTLFSCYNGSILYPGAGVNKIEEVRRLAGSVCIAHILILLWYVFFPQVEEIRIACIIFSMMLTVIVLPISRGLMRRVMKYFQIGQTNILIAGAGKGGAQIAYEFSQDSYFGFKVVGFLDDDPAKQGQIISGYPVLGPLVKAQEIAKTHNAFYLVCCIPVSVLTKFYSKFTLYFKHIMIVPAIQIFPIAWVTPISIGVFSGFEVKNKLLQPFSRLLKLVVEIVLSAVALVGLLPLFIILVPLIKFTSSGPVFYRATRLGQNGKEIQVWKFRTMYEDADEKLAQLLKSNPELRAQWEQDFKLQSDPRITPVGNFLRKTSLDELPQFWNVLNGTMSIIGPRPITDEEVGYYGKHYALRKRVKPGITGLWQVSGRSNTSYELRVMLDTYYIMNWSVWMDYYIFFKTIYIVLMRKGAR